MTLQMLQIAVAGSALVQSLLGPQAPNGGHAVGRAEGQRPSFVSPAAGVLCTVSSQAVVAACNPQFGTSRVGGNGSMPAPKSLEDPRVSRKVLHPDSWTLSMDLSGPLAASRDEFCEARYMLVGVLTVPVLEKRVMGL